MSILVADDFLACPTEIHDEIKSDPHRVKVETLPIGALTHRGAVMLYLRVCAVCKSTMAFEEDVDASADPALVVAHDT